MNTHASWSRDANFQAEVEKAQRQGWTTKVIFAPLHPGEPSQWLLYCYPHGSQEE